jgi:putative membrane protein
MKRTLGIFAVAAALACAPAFAQSTDPQTGKVTNPTKGQTASPKDATPTGPKMKGGQKGAPEKGGNLSAADRAFVKDAAAGGLAEVELGDLAKQKASSSDVKQFGDRMVTDHSKANDELKTWAREKGIVLPNDLDPKHKALRDKLSKLSGDEFDKAYMREMVSDHEKDVAAFKKESTSAKDADLKNWAGKTLPTLEDHLKQAKGTAAKVGAGK